MAAPGRLETVKSLHLAGLRLEAMRKSWKNDLDRVTRDHAYNPSKPHIQPSTSISEALIVLGRSLALRNSRSALFEMRKYSLTEVLIANVKRRQSTETNTWFAKRCLVRAELDLLACHASLQTAEAARTHDIESLLNLQKDLVELERSERMVLLVNGVALSERAFDLLGLEEEATPGLGDDESGEVKRQVETALTAAGNCRSLLGRIDRSVNYLLLMVSSMGGEMSRQTMITEFFKPVV